MFPTLLLVVSLSSKIKFNLLDAIINRPPPVKVGACRALLQLLPDMNRSVILPQITDLFSSLTNLLHQVNFSSDYLSNQRICLFFFCVTRDFNSFIQATDETLVLVLETLQQTIKAGKQTYLLLAKNFRNLVMQQSSPISFFFCHLLGHEASASIESIISPVILNVWVAHVSDPFMSIDIIDVLEVNRVIVVIIHFVVRIAICVVCLC